MAGVTGARHSKAEEPATGEVPGAEVEVVEDSDSKVEASKGDQ